MNLDERKKREEILKAQVTNTEKIQESRTNLQETQMPWVAGFHAR